MSKRHFPDFIDAYLEYTKNHEASKKIHKWTAISTVAAAIERKIWMDREYYVLFPNMFIVIVGRSGMTKKSTSTGIGTGMLRELPDFHFGPERITAATLIEVLSLSHKTFLHQNEKVSHCSVFLYASEFKQFIDEVFGDIVPLMTTFYDCQPNNSKTPWIYRTKKNGETKVYGPCINFLGCSTEAWLSSVINQENTEGGFSSRILFVVERDPPENPVAWPKVTEQMRELKPKLQDDLEAIYELSGEMKISPKAYMLFDEWYRFHIKQVMPMFNDPRFSGYMGRKGDILLKLAMIKNVSRGDSLELSPEDIIWAGEELEALEGTMFDAFGGLNEQEFELSRAKVASAIKCRDFLAEAEIRRIFMKEVLGHDMDKILRSLVEAKMITRVTNESAFGAIHGYTHVDNLKANSHIKVISTES